jgi:hypothetical protein
MTRDAEHLVTPINLGDVDATLWTLLRISTQLMHRRNVIWVALVIEMQVRGSDDISIRIGFSARFGAFLLIFTHMWGDSALAIVTRSILATCTLRVYLRNKPTTICRVAWCVMFGIGGDLRR